MQPLLPDRADRGVPGPDDDTMQQRGSAAITQPAPDNADRVTPHDADGFAGAIVDTLLDPAKMDRLRRGAKEAGSRYTMEAMIDNYSAGIKKCLAIYGLSPVLDPEEVPAA